jgi:callose synthase
MEDVLYTRKALETENEDGISILYYLQKIYPGTFDFTGIDEKLAFRKKLLIINVCT